MFKSSKIHSVDEKYYAKNNIVNELNYHYIKNNTDSVSNNNCKKIKYILGCDEYDMKPPLCCRLLKRLGICFMINRYFKRKRKIKIRNEH